MAARTLFGARTPTDEGNGAKETRLHTELTHETGRKHLAIQKPTPKICQESLSNAKFTKMTNSFAKPLEE
jgi:hypothetical protein